MSSPPISVNGVPCWIAYEETAGQAFTVSVDRQNGAAADVLFKCDGNRLFDLIGALMGTVSFNGRQFVRNAPFALPASPNLRCENIGQTTGIKPRTDQSSGWTYYQQLLVPAHFSVPVWQYGNLPQSGQNDPSGQPYTVTKFRTSGEVFRPPDGAYYIGPFPGALKVAEAEIGILRPKTEISMTRKFCPFVPLQLIESLIGTVNANPLTFADRTYPRGYALFAGPNTEPGNDPIGNPCCDIEYVLLANADHDWNQVQAPDGSWQYLNTSAAGSGSFPFPYADFSVIP